MKKLISTLISVLIFILFFNTTALCQHENDLHFGISSSGKLDVMQPPTFEVPKIMYFTAGLYIRDQGVDFYVPNGWNNYQLSACRWQSTYITPGLVGGNYFGGSNPGYMNLTSSNPHIHMPFGTTAPGTYLMKFILNNGFDWQNNSVPNSIEYTMIWVAGSNYALVDLPLLRNLPDTPSGSPYNGFAGVYIKDLIVSAVFYNGFYAQTENRTGGVFISTSSASVDVGDKVEIKGTLGTNGAERVIYANEINAESGSAPKPLYVNLRNVGGASSGRHTPATKQGVGLSTTGLLIKASGVIKYSDYGDAYLDDGSSVTENMDGIKGIKISQEYLSSSLTLPSEGQYTTVVGVSGTEVDFNDDIIPVIRPRGQFDINP